MIRLQADPEGDRDPVPSFAQALAQPSEPAMDHDLDITDRDDPTPDPPPSPAPHPRRPNLVATVLGLLSKIPLPSIGSERHEMVLDPAPSTPHPAGSPAAPGPRLVKSRLSLLLLQRETRVGIAAVFSFAVLVGSLLFNRDWIKSSTSEPPALAKPIPLLAMKNQADGTQPDGPKAEPGGEGDPKGDSEKGPGAGNPPQPAKPPESSPAKPRERNPIEPTETLPKPIEGRNPAELGDRRSPDAPPSLPAGDEPMPRPLDPPPMGNDPPALPEPKDDPAPRPAPDSPPPTPEPKPREAETTPAMPPAASIPPAPPAEPSPMIPPGEPATMNPPSEPIQPPPTTAEAVPEPIPTPSPTSTSVEPAPSEILKAPESPPTSSRVGPAGPVPTERPPMLETVPAGSIEPAATKTSTAGALRAGWIAIPSGGRRIVGAIPIISTPAEAQVDTPRIADGPRVVDDPAAVDQVEPVVHAVQPGENFWTISQLYYRSPRFYKALHAANRGQVPDITKLYVGTVLRIPPPEALERPLIDPPGRAGEVEPKTSTVSRTSNSRRAEPPSAEEADLAMPARRRVIQPAADPEAEPKPVRRPTYKIKPYDTLRSIARDTLDDPKRDREIYNLNREVLDDFKDPLPDGTTITLPSDAGVGVGVGRRSR